MTTNATVRVRYTGPGGEIFGDWHWQPEPGEERDLELTSDERAALADHPTLELTGGSPRSSRKPVVAKAVRKKEAPAPSTPPAVPAAPSEEN